MYHDSLKNPDFSLVVDKISILKSSNRFSKLFENFAIPWYKSKQLNPISVPEICIEGGSIYAHESTFGNFFPFHLLPVLLLQGRQKVCGSTMPEIEPGQLGSDQEQ